MGKILIILAGFYLTYSLREFSIWREIGLILLSTKRKPAKEIAGCWRAWALTFYEKKISLIETNLSGPIIFLILSSDLMASSSLSDTFRIKAS